MRRKIINPLLLLRMAKGKGNKNKNKSNATVQSMDVLGKGKKPGEQRTPNSPKTPVQGFALNTESGSAISKFALDTPADDSVLLSPSAAMEEIVQGSRAKTIEVLQTTPCEEVIAQTHVSADVNVDNMDAYDDDLIEICDNDIKDELEYWSLSVIMCIYGANPRIGMIDGYARRLWGNLNVDKIIPIKKSFFMIRFLNKETMQKALDAKYLLFDNKPVFIKEWQHDGMVLDVEEFKRVPVWVQLPALPLRYWGCLLKLLGKVGKPLNPDQATTNRDRIAYARVLVEMDINKVFPKNIQFKNEKGVVVSQELEFEWKPPTQWENDGQGLHNVKQKKVWRPIKKAVVSQEEETTQPEQQPTNEGDGFVLAKKTMSARRNHSNREEVGTSNMFGLIQADEPVIGVDDMDAGDQEMNVLDGQSVRDECKGA